MHVSGCTGAEGMRIDHLCVHVYLWTMSACVLDAVLCIATNCIVSKWQKRTICILSCILFHIFHNLPIIDSLRELDSIFRYHRR